MSNYFISRGWISWRTTSFGVVLHSRLWLYFSYVLWHEGTYQAKPHEWYGPRGRPLLQPIGAPVSAHGPDLSGFLNQALLFFPQTLRSCLTEIHESVACLSTFSLFSQPITMLLTEGSTQRRLHRFTTTWGILMQHNEIKMQNKK